MRLRRLRRSRWAAWLGVAALVLNALVPVHLAFDLGEAVAPAHPAKAESGRDFQWRVLAALTGHELSEQGQDRDRDRHQHGSDCPVCGALGSLSGLTLAAPPALSVAPSVTAALPAAAVIDRPDDPPPAAYRSRAPPAA